MFRFLKDKLKSAVKNFSKNTEEELLKEPEGSEQEAFARELEKVEKTLTETAEGKPQEETEKEPETKDESPEHPALDEIRKDLQGKSVEIQAEEKKKTGFIGRISSPFKAREGQEGNVLKRLAGAITTKKISPDKFDELFEDLDIVMLENNVAVEVIDKIRSDLKETLVNKPVQGRKVEEAVIRSLKNSVEQLFEVEKIDIVERIRSKKPFVIMFAGINGSGKTTTIAKIVKFLQDKGIKCVVAASDTFRAAAIHQMQEHTDRLGIKLIKHDYGADPAAVAFDAKKYAEARNIDVVLIDTAGRQHSNANLIEELKKIVRVAKPDLKIFVGESIAGNDCVNQASKFNEAIGIDGIVLAKADVDEKGGAAISVSYVTGKPILYLGTGQGYGDLTEFKSEAVVSSLGLAG